MPNHPNFPSRWPGAAMLAVALLAGCGARSPANVQVERRLDGELQPGPFIPPHAYEWYLRGELALAHGAPEEAVEAFELAIAQQARTTDAYVLSRLALARARAGAPQAAERALQEAERLSPCVAEVWVVRGELAVAADAHQDALAHFTRALECRPHYADAERELVETLLQLGATERAAEVVRTQGAPLLNGDAPQRGGALTLSARALELERALERNDHEALQRLYPEEPLRSALPQALSARVLSALGRYREAADAWSQAAPLPQALLVEAAEDYAHAGFWPEAEAAADAVRGSDDFDATVEHRVRRVLARARYVQGAVQAALETLPEDDRATLAEWLQQAGAPGLARETWGASTTQ